MRNAAACADRLRLSKLLSLRFAGSALAIAVSLPAPLFAQEAAAPVPGSEDEDPDGPLPPEADDYPNEIVVSGIRRGIEDAISIKRDATSIVEAVSAEDIGKLPDLSIAESIARLPGLAAQRVNGRAQVISIRGLAPDFTTTLLNGRQQASSGDNRAVEFDQYPSELLSSVVIYKTPDSEIAGMGLSGTADLRTVRPLLFGKQAFAVNLRGEKTEGERLNDDVRNYGFRASASYIDQFANDTLGIALGYAHLDSPSSNRHFKAYNYEAFGFAVTPDSADDALVINGQEIFVTSRLNKRDAFIGILEWEPSDRVHLTFDGYYSHFYQNEITRGAQWFSNPYADDLRFTDIVTEDRGGTPVALSGVANRFVPILRNDNNQRSDDLFSAGLNAEFQMDDRTRFIADLSYSRNKRDEQILETYAGYGLGDGGVTPGTPNVGRTFDDVAFETPEDGFPTYGEGLDYADASQVSLGDRAPWGGWGHDGAIRFPEVEEDVYSLDLRLAHETEGFFSGFGAGVNYTRRDKRKFVLENDLFLKDGRQQVLIDPDFLEEPTSLGFAGFGDVISYNASDLLSTYYDQQQIRDANFFDKNWKVTEDVVTFFAKASIDWGSLRGNVGVQAVSQTQRSSGVIINGDNPISRVVQDSYLDILPSLNLIYDLGGGHRLRFSASKTLARPRIDELRANVTPGFNSLVCTSQGADVCTPGQTVNPFSASGGNPNLKPWRADAVDAAYEWYLNPTSYLSIAGFYKKLNSYIYQRVGLFDFTGIPLPIGASQIPDDVIISRIGQITLPDNGEGGHVKGLEFSGAFNFGTITSALDGFGVLGSLSLTDSNLNPVPETIDNPVPDEAQTVRIPGLSGTVYNITGYYERDGFQARISQRYRSGFKGEVVQLFATRGFTEILADKQVDAQIGYTVQSGALEGLGFLFQVNNLTNSPYRTRIGLDGGGVQTEDGGSLLETYEEYGRNFLLGINYRF